MKAIKYWGASLALLILVACTKSELESATELTADSATVTSLGDNTTAKWSTVSNAGAANEAVAFAGEIKDDAITEEVMESGLVLVFAKNANQVQSLPFQEESAELRYWYYHVSQGSVFIQANSSKAATVTTAQNFAVIVLDKSQLEALETNGTSRDLLLGMSLEQVSTLLKK